MRSCTILLVAMGWVSTAASELAQDKYTIKFKELGKGESSQVEHLEAMITKVSAQQPNDLVPKTFEMKGNKHYTYTDAILERPEGSPMPTKVRRVYERAVVETIEADGVKPFGPSLNGKTVVIEKKGPQYEFRSDGGEVLNHGIDDLIDEFNKGGQVKLVRMLLPPDPVAVNESWNIDAKEFLPDRDNNVSSIKGPKSNGTAKLLKVYKKDGRLYGVIDAVLSFQ
jgi:hypothetical protein